MTHVLKHFTLVAIIFALCALVTPVFAIGISVGTVTAAPGEKAVIPVYLTDNNMNVASLTIPLQFSSSDITIDSVTYGGTLLRPNMSSLTQIDNPNQFIRITYVPASGIPVITASSGPLAFIHFTVKPGAFDQTVYIDSVNTLAMIGSIEYWTRVEVTDSLGLSVTFPDFSEGDIIVQMPLDVDNDQTGLPSVLALNQNYPNPFNPSTTISYSIPDRAHVDLRVYNILGQEVEQLVDDTKPAGEYEVTWQAGHVASGIYFYRLAYQDKVLTKKMTLLK